MTEGEKFGTFVNMVNYMIIFHNPKETRQLYYIYDASLYIIKVEIISLPLWSIYIP
jgi:hypothetical protein